MKWCTISNKHVVGPYGFQNDNITGETYRTILIQYVFLRRRELREDCMFHQDGAPFQYSIRRKPYLVRKLPNRWIRIGGLILWPLRSFNLRPCCLLLMKKYQIRDMRHFDRLYWRAQNENQGQNIQIQSRNPAKSLGYYETTSEPHYTAQCEPYQNFSTSKTSTRH